MYLHSLASFLCGAGIAGASDVISSDVIAGFGLFKTYSTDHPVILRADREPYYSNVTKMVCTDVSLAAKLKDGYSGEMPEGTLTVIDSSVRYMLTPADSSDNFCLYVA